jgi:hypothetical protein
MRWKNKVLVVLIIYFAGFATAIYSLAPASNQAAGPTEPNPAKSFSHSLLGSDGFAQSINSGMRTCVKAGSYVAEFLKQKLTQDKEASQTAARK